MTKPRHNFGLALARNSIFIGCGSSNKEIYTNEVERFDIRSKRWINCGDTNLKKTKCSFTNLG